MRSMVASALVFLTFLAFSSNTLAQRPEGGRVEFSMLGGLNVLTYEGYYGGDDTESYLAVPSGSSVFPLSSMLRMSFWTNSLLVTDLGVSILNVSDGGEITVVNLEGGISAAFGESNANTFPFAGVLVGILSLSNGDTDNEGFVGFQGGLRHFFRPHAAMRMQVAYRRFLSDELRLESSLEIAAGLSFLI
jgi:hypothetical protein